MKTAIRFEDARKPARQEWFIAGTERNLVRSAASRELARIAYPVDGTVVALDPDIPPKLQRLPLKLSSAAEKDWRWRMDHQALGRAIGHAFWLPQPGHHRLSLEDARGRELDAVSFEVWAIKGR